MEDFVEIDVEKIDALRNAYNETINSKSFYKIIGGKKMSIGHEIENQKVEEIVKDYKDEAYRNVDSMLFDVALEGYEEGFADGADSIINTCIRLSSYDKDVLIGIFFDDTYTEDNEKNPIKAILTLMTPNTINSKLDAFDKECKENNKEVSAIVKLMAGKNGRIHSVKIGEKKDEYEFELIQQVRDAAKRISEYSCEELLDIFGVAGLPEYRFSQYLMDYSVNQINAKLDEYDSKNRMKAENEKLINEMLEKFEKCIAEGGSKQDIKKIFRELFLNN